MEPVTELTAAPDTLLAGRYRLQHPVGRTSGCTTTWRGLDEILARPVAVKILDDPGRLAGGTAAFLDAAVAAGRLTHPRVASVLDAAEEGGLTYVVGEWVDGKPLSEVLREGPLSPARATTVAAQVAETVAYAHSRDVRHLDLDAGNVIVCADGAVKVTDFEVGAASRPEGAPEPPDADLPNEERDTRAVARLLYECLTARPPQYRDGHLLSPRQVRAGVPREVDAVVVRTLLPEVLRKSAPITTPTELLAALAPLPGEGGGTTARALPPDEPRIRKPRRWLRIGVPVLLIGGVGVAGAAAGLAIGRLPGRASKLPGLGIQQSAQPPASALPGTKVAPASVRDYDPLGDGEESHTEVALAYNGDPSDAWHTTTYYNSPAFGNLKSGAGLLFDFGTPQTFDHVVVAFGEPGESVELRAADAVGNDPAAVPVVASATDAKVPLTLKPAPGTQARYWVLWITKLVKNGDGKYSAAVAEVGFFR